MGRIILSNILKSRFGYEIFVHPQHLLELQRDCRYVQKDRRADFPTKNGEGDLVVMDIETYNRREKMLKSRA